MSTQPSDEPSPARSTFRSVLGAGESQLPSLTSSESALAALGWDDDHATAFEPFHREGLLPARVALAQRGHYRLNAALGELGAALAGSLRRAADPGELPVVGDWVAVEAQPGGSTAVIRAVLPRRSAFVRKAAGALTEQVLAANLDTLLLVSGLDGDFNPRRIERYLVAAWQSGARPVVVLSKADLCADLGERIKQVEAVAPGVPIHPVSSVTGLGIEALAAYVRPGRTVALLGSSGAGKSTLLNRLVGRDLQQTGAVRTRDDRGRHTTTRRELIVLPGGGLVIDTPGLREVQPWEAAEGERAAFVDLERLAAACRFPDCHHESEPGCAVRAAVASGDLASDRLESYQRLGRERRALEVRLDKRARAEQERRQRSIHKFMRHYRPRG